jgi:hypothetical protein
VLFLISKLILDGATHMLVLSFPGLGPVGIDEVTNLAVLPARQTHRIIRRERILWLFPGSRDDARGCAHRIVARRESRGTVARIHRPATLGGEATGRLVIQSVRADKPDIEPTVTRCCFGQIRAGLDAIVQKILS